MHFVRNTLLAISLCFFLPTTLSAKSPDLTSAIVTAKLEEIMKAHASHKTLNDELIQRTLGLYLDLLDPNKSYLLESDIDQWLNPSKEMLQKIALDYHKNDFTQFEEIHKVMAKSILRMRQLDKDIDPANLPKDVKAKEFKEMKWVQSQDDLLNRIKRIKALQFIALEKLSPDQKDKTLRKLDKIKEKNETNILVVDKEEHERFVLSNVLKAFSASLDSHTVYFTPDEANQFMVDVQQRLSGIGAQLRDDLNGYTIIKIIEGGPAAKSKELKVKDRIIAINGESIVGLDIAEGVKLIRGEDGTKVTLTIVRENETNEKDPKTEETLEFVITRGEVVFKEMRYESSYEPFGDGVIAYLKLFSFYQDAEYSSAEDLKEALNKLRKDHLVKGVILDLRFNSGGLLTQAVDVTGLFISKGIVVSIKDNTGKIQHLRTLESEPEWNGPLIVLVNRASASAAEIVSGTLQDYGRALIVGDDHTFGKGSFQTFTLSFSQATPTVNPQGEYKVTRGRYYTVSGKTPQLTGVHADIVIPGVLSETDIGEKFAKYPLENDQISANFEDDLSDLPFYTREKVRYLYKYNLQKPLTTYLPYMHQLSANCESRIKNNKNFQSFLKELKKTDFSHDEEPEEFGNNDLQLVEAYNVMKDLIVLMN